MKQANSIRGLKKVPLVIAVLFLSAPCYAQITANSCSTSDVQTAINSASAGQTVNVPSGTCTWTTGVSVTAGVNLSGAGGGRVIAVDLETTAETLGTGTKTFSGVANDMGASNYLNSTAPPITVGETLRIMEDGWVGNYFQGTVTSFSGTTLVMNITSSGGTCGQTETGGMSSNCKRWLISTLPSTIICNSISGESSALFNLTESTTYNGVLSGFFVGQGYGSSPDPRCSGDVAQGQIVVMNYTSGGVALLIHDNFFERENEPETIRGNTNRGVIWNNSFVASTFGENQDAAISVKDPNNSSMAGSSWGSAADWGSLDTNGQHALYFETNDIHAYNNGWTDCDDGCRLVVRYNFIDNSGGSSHGADTSFIGMRTMEFYDNAGWFQSYGDGTTANINWWFFDRGGTFVWHDNTLPQISSTDWGSKGDIILAVLSLGTEGNYPCWGSGATSGGEYYPALRQVGLGYVTGSGTVNYPPLGFNNASTSTNSGAYTGSIYVGDSEPIYIWNDNRSMIVGSETSTQTGCTNPDSISNYVESGRDYFNGTAKSGYTPYTYPNPLTQGGSTPSPAPATTMFAGANLGR